MGNFKGGSSDPPFFCSKWLLQLPGWIDSCYTFPHIHSGPSFFSRVFLCY